MTPRPRTQSESGFTLIEVLVAALILVLAFTALAAVFIGAQNQATADVRESQLINVADQQIELVRGDVDANGFSNLGMTAAPVAVTLPAGVAATRLNAWTDATRLVNGSAPGAGSNADCLDILANYDNSFGGSAADAPVGFNPWQNCATGDGEPLAIPTATATGALVTVNTQGSGGWAADAWPPACPASPAVATPCTATLGSGFKVTVYTFVTDTYAACGTSSATGTALVGCPTVSAAGEVTGCTPTGSFPTTATVSTPCADARRVTVAVVSEPTRALARQTPVYISTIFTNPIPSSSQNSSLGLTVTAGL